MKIYFYNQKQKSKNENIKKYKKKQFFTKDILYDLIFVCISIFKANTYFISIAQLYSY